MSPLDHGSGKKVIQRNISEMIKAGHPADQASAAAHRKARESGRVQGPKKKRRR